MKYISIPFFIFFFLVNHAFGGGIIHPKIKWAFKTQGPVRASSVISDGSIYFGSTDGFLYALNKEDGSLLWKLQAQGAITASPAVAGTSVFIVSRDHYLYSINKYSGKLNWKFKTGRSCLLPTAVGIILWPRPL